MLTALIRTDSGYTCMWRIVKLDHFYSTRNKIGIFFPRVTIILSYFKMHFIAKLFKGFLLTISIFVMNNEYETNCLHKR